MYESETVFETCASKRLLSFSFNIAIWRAILAKIKWNDSGRAQGKLGTCPRRVTEPALSAYARYPGAAPRAGALNGCAWNLARPNILKASGLRFAHWRKRPQLVVAGFEHACRMRPRDLSVHNAMIGPMVTIIWHLRHGADIPVDPLRQFL